MTTRKPPGRGRRHRQRPASVELEPKTRPAQTPRPDRPHPGHAKRVSGGTPTRSLGRPWSKPGPLLRLLSTLVRGLGPEAQLWTVLLLVMPILAVGLTLTVGLTLRRRPFVDYDYWWHLATGNWILDHHRIPTTDPFSWSHGGQDWLVDEWLAEAILALLVRAGGYAGAIVFTAATAVAAYWLLLRAARSYGLSRRAACLVMLLWGGMFLRVGVLAVRPQAWCFALFGLLFAELAAYDTGRRRSLWILPAMFALWINLNLTAIIGLGLFGTFVLDRIVQRRIDRHLWIVSLLSAAAIVVNPRGVDLVLLIQRYSDPHAVRYTFIYEWTGPIRADHSFVPFWLGLPMVPLVVWQLVRWRPRLWPALPVLIACYESFKARRYIPIYAMVILLFAGWLVWRWARARDTVPGTAGLPLVRWRPATITSSVLAVAVVLLLAVRLDGSQFRREPNAYGYPVAATNRLLDRYPHARLFNTYSWGGYLIYRLTPTNQVFIDGREVMYGDAFTRQYLSLLRGERGWQERFAKDGINAALVERSSGIAVALARDKGWRLIYYDADFTLFVRN